MDCPNSTQNRSKCQPEKPSPRKKEADPTAHLYIALPAHQRQNLRLAHEPGGAVYHLSAL